MPTLVLHNPAGNRVENPNLKSFRSAFLSNSNDYWSHGSGDAMLEFIDGESTKKLLVLPNDQLHIYLKYIDEDSTWLSLHDRERLAEVVQCSDEWNASVGLFLPREMAWLAVEEFCETGKRSKHVAWISPNELPDEGNW